ncbi:hypothetical protein CRG98_003420 [Punica granatum]|uniref:Uncharacterized protein n=1 Tax=Punica granatum TaxID=22663 RepID=A0A2I0L6E0_PUNGR|nr:hypothetical protein CRG98_003420 [Punica granatum]
MESTTFNSAMAKCCQRQMRAPPRRICTCGEGGRCSRHWRAASGPQMLRSVWRVAMGVHTVRPLGTSTSPNLMSCCASRIWEIGRTRRLLPENRKNFPDLDCLNSGEAQIDHGEVSAVSRTITGVHSSPHCDVQGREPPPAASSPLFSAIPTARRLTGLGPFPLLHRSSPNLFGPTRQAAQHSSPAQRLFQAVSPLGG